MGGTGQATTKKTLLRDRTGSNAGGCRGRDQSHMSILISQAAFHVGPGWAPGGQSWAPNGPRMGLTGAHLGMLLGMAYSMEPYFSSFPQPVLASSYHTPPQSWIGGHGTSYTLYTDRETRGRPSPWFRPYTPGGGRGSYRGVVCFSTSAPYRSSHQIATCGGGDAYIGFKPR